MTTTPAHLPTPSKLANELKELQDEYGRFVSYPQAAQITTVSVRTLKRLTAEGQLPCYTVGSKRALRLRTSDVAGLIRRVA